MNTNTPKTKANWISALWASLGTVAMAVVAGAVLPTAVAVPLALLLPFAIPGGSDLVSAHHA